MKRSDLILVLAMLGATPAMAQSDVATADAPMAAASPAVTPKRGAMVSSSDGLRVGRIEYVRGDMVGVIHDGRFVNIPVTTLSGVDGGFKSTLTRSEIKKR